MCAAAGSSHTRIEHTTHLLMNTHGGAMIDSTTQYTERTTQDTSNHTAATRSTTPLNAHMQPSSNIRTQTGAMSK